MALKNEPKFLILALSKVDLSGIEKLYCFQWENQWKSHFKGGVA